jgi:hypothetical protein
MAEQKSAEAKAEEARIKAEADAQAATDKAQQEEADAKAKAEAAEQKSALGSGKLVVLTGAFVARTDEKNTTATKRYGQGEEFHPVKGVHDVDELVKLGVLGRTGGRGGPLRRSTALDLSQKAAAHFQENSPVIDLQSQPFEQVDRNSEPEPATAPGQ